jgi:hypothetical protein
MAGYFFGSITLGNTTLATAIPSAFNIRSGYVAKWNIATRQFVWAVQTNGQQDQYITQMAVQGNSIYVAGAYAGDTGSFGSITLTNSDNGPSVYPFFDGFVAKLVDNGSSASFVWAQSVGGSGQSDYAQCVAVNGSSVYVGGNFGSPVASFGSITLTNNTTVGAAFDAFVAKLTDTGNSSSFVWAQRAGGLGNDQALQMASNGPNVYVTGIFDSNTALFGTTTLTKSTANNHFRNSYVAKLTDSGTSGGFAWVVQDDIDNSVSNMAISGNNLYMARSFTGTAVLGTTTLTSAGDYDLVVAKMTDAGTTANYTWIKQAGGTGSDACNSVAVQGNTVYASGGFTGASLALGATTLPNPAPAKSEGYIAKLTDMGTTANFTWADRFGGSDNDSGGSLALFGGKVHVTGYTGVPATFGSLPLNGAAATNAPTLATLSDVTLAATAKSNSVAFSLYPNPARTTTTVLLPAGVSSSATTIALLDALGRIIRTNKVLVPPAGARHELPLGNLPAGVYSVRVTTAAASGTQRLVVQ